MPASDTQDSNCPLCQASGKPRFAKQGMMIRQCTRCGHQFWIPPTPDAHVSTVYGDDYFCGSSGGYLDYVGEEVLQRASARYYCRVLSRFTRPGRVLDIGAACGFFVREFQDAGWQATGIEPNASMCEIGRQRLQVDLSNRDLTELPSEPRFDLITLIQVISHLIDPAEMLRQIRQRLVDGGLFLVETWDRHSWAARVSGRSWHEYNPPSVLHWFTRRSLREFVESFGWRAIASGIPRKRIQVGRGVRMIRHATEHSRWGRWLTWPLALAPPDWTIPYVLGDAFWMLFRAEPTR